MWLIYINYLFYIFAHTVLDSEKLDTSYLPALSENSRLLHQKLLSQKNTALLEYIDTGVSMKATRAATITNKYIKNPDYYRKLEAFGQWDGDDRCPDGCCGFTGLNMLISYHDKYKNDNIMDDNYWVDNSNKTKMKAGKYSLTKHLFELAPKATTTSMHNHSVMKLYLKERKV